MALFFGGLELVMASSVTGVAARQTKPARSAIESASASVVQVFRVPTPEISRKSGEFALAVRRP
jgi:hypothetical protein